MPILPDGKLAQIEFFEAHNPVWAASATSIGLTSGLVTTLTTYTAAARAAYNAAQSARDASRAA